MAASSSGSTSSTRSPAASRWPPPRRRRRPLARARASAPIVARRSGGRGQRHHRRVRQPDPVRRRGRPARHRPRPTTAGRGRPRAPGGRRAARASSRRAIIVSETIEVSSTTTTSCGSRLRRWCRNRTLLSGRQPSSRCRVVACSPVTRARSASLGHLGGGLVDRLLQPGSGLAGRGGQRDAGRLPGCCSCCSARRASRPATAVVLPVPGPPVSTVVHCPAAARTAARCSSYPSAGKTRARPALQQGGVDLGGSTAQPGHQVVADLPLLAPVAVEVEGAASSSRSTCSATSGLAATSSTQPGGIGPGQLRRSSSSTARSSACSATVARSTQIEPCRTARTASAAASSTCSRASSRIAPKPGRDVHVGGAEHVGLVERAQQPGGAEREPPVAAVEGLGGHDATSSWGPAWVALPDPSLAGRRAGRRAPPPGRRGVPREHPARVPVDLGRLRAAHPAQVEVEDAPEMAARGRSPAGATAGSGAAPRSTAGPAAGSGSAASPRSSSTGCSPCAVSGSPGAPSRLVL